MGSGDAPRWRDQTYTVPLGRGVWQAWVAGWQLSGTAFLLPPLPLPPRVGIQGSSRAAAAGMAARRGSQGHAASQLEPPPGRALKLCLLW